MPLKTSKFYNFSQKIRFFKTTGKFKNFEPKKQHQFVDLGKLILKIYTVFRFDIVFHKLIEENLKKICVEISSPLILIIY
jgi:hypothetical protein